MFNNKFTKEDSDLTYTLLLSGIIKMDSKTQKYLDIIINNNNLIYSITKIIEHIRK